MPEDNIETTEPTTVDTSEVSAEAVTEPDGTYVVKIDGEEQQVSLNELQDGYQRQADYTRKTQELAEERQRLSQAEAIASALETDPSGTIAALSSAFGVEDNLPVNSGTEYDSETVDEDPNAKRLAQLENQVARQAQVQRQQALEKEVAGLKRKYGDFDAAELFRHALTNKIPNLDAAFTHMKYGEVADTAEKLQKINIASSGCEEGATEDS